MRNCKRMPYAQIIRWRIRVSYALLALMLAIGFGSAIYLFGA